MVIKHISKLGTAILLAVLVFSCGKETQSTTQGGGTFVIKATISPPLQAGKNGMQQSNQVQLSCVTSQFWSGIDKSTSLSEISTDPISVTSGQNVSCILSISNGYDFVCRTVTLEGIQNGKTIKTYTLSLGYNSSSLTTCIDGNGGHKNFIIQ